MNEDVLRQAGLTKAEATIYIILVKNSPASPPRLADLANESRTNTYKLLDSLETKGLVSRDGTQKKLRYWANNPSNLLDLLKKQRTEVEAVEKRYQDSLPAMIDEYFTYSEQPSIRYFHGIDGIKQIYQDHLATGQPVTYIHSESLIRSFGVDNLHLIRNQYPKKGIHRHLFYPDITPILDPHESKTPVDESDRIMLATRTWLDENDLVEPVEWSVYGNKLSIISLGTESIGMIIESPQIAASFKEILDLLDRKIKSEPGYKKLPKKMHYTKTPESLK